MCLAAARDKAALTGFATKRRLARLRRRTEARADLAPCRPWRLRIAVLAFATARASRPASRGTSGSPSRSRSPASSSLSLADRRRRPDHRPDGPRSQSRSPARSPPARAPARSAPWARSRPALGLAARPPLLGRRHLAAKLVGYGGSRSLSRASSSATRSGRVSLQARLPVQRRADGAGLATLATNAVPIMARFLVFGEKLPHGARGSLQLPAFVTLVVGAAFLARAPATTKNGAARPRRKPASTSSGIASVS